MADTILVTGANGQLGKKVKETFSKKQNINMVYTDIDEMDITSRREVEQKLEELQPTVLINCSAYTAVDKAETERKSALKINQKGPLVLSEKCKKYNTFLIHISTDYVLSGEGFKPYSEDEPIRPINYYGETKALGEEAIQKNYNNAVIIRTAWLYSEHGNNFVKTMLKLGKERQQLGVIDDQVGTPTYAGDLANAIKNIVLQYLSNDDFDKGIYHFTNEGVCSWFDFALKIQSLAGNNVITNPIPTKDFPTPAKRPHYSVLSKRKIKSNFQINIPHWEESLKKCLSIINNTIENKQYR